MVVFSKIKLIIWDMDETFWKGTLSEGDVVVEESIIQCIKDLTDAGIINSICSKNDKEPVLSKLDSYQLKDYFVFPSINWDPKGMRIKQLISDMQLRDENVLFIDDNPSNLGEAKHFCPSIMTATPEYISTLVLEAQQCEKKDLGHKRLKQYKVLEEKNIEKKQFGSNEEFLLGSGIKLEVHTDCVDVLERIHDLVIRTNQLNFTKLRSSKEELLELLSSSDVNSGYVSVSDKFGDYGIVGFYAVRNNRAVHFCFSCRTLGMGIEQYVYNSIGRPTLDIVGEVTSSLESEELPKWINCESSTSETNKMNVGNISQHQVLIKGPCDLFQIFPYISNVEMFDTEFTHSVYDGRLVIESTGHTTHIVEALRLSEQQKQKVVSEVPFAHMDMYCDNIYKLPYKAVFISILADANLGVYRRRETGEQMAIMEYIHPLTDEKNWEGIISGEYPNSGFSFTREILKDFSEKYEFCGRNTPEKIVENLEYIRTNLPDDCILSIMLGGEIYYEKNTFEAYMDRHIVHKNINESIRCWAKKYANVKLIDVNDYLKDQSSFYDHFNHYIKPVYYSIAGEVVKIVNEHIGCSVKEKSKLAMLKIRLKEILAPIYRKIVKKRKK